MAPRLPTTLLYRVVKIPSGLTSDLILQCYAGIHNHNIVEGVEHTKLISRMFRQIVWNSMKMLLSTTVIPVFSQSLLLSKPDFLKVYNSLLLAWAKTSSSESAIADELTPPKNPTIPEAISRSRYIFSEYFGFYTLFPIHNTKYRSLTWGIPRVKVNKRGHFLEIDVLRPSGVVAVSIYSFQNIDFARQSIEIHRMGF